MWKNSKAAFFFELMDNDSGAERELDSFWYEVSVLSVCSVVGPEQPLTPLGKAVLPSYPLRLAPGRYDFCPPVLGMLTRIVLLTVGLSFGFARRSDRKAKKYAQRKAIRDTHREAREFKKQGCDVIPGSPPTEKQLEYIWIKLYQPNEKREHLYLSADGNATAQTRAAAEMQALDSAQLSLASQLQTFTQAITEANIASAHLTIREAAPITELPTAAQNLILTSIPQLDPACKIFRTLPVKQVELNLSCKQAVQEAKKKVQQELSNLFRAPQNKVHKPFPLQ